MNKYDPLARWLRNQSGFEVSVRLTEIEAIIAALLPDSAWMLTAWWANDARPVQSRAWVREGWRAYPRLVSGKIGTVIFKRDKREESVAEPLHGFRILLVEDNDDNRFALTALLEVMGGVGLGRWRCGNRAPAAGRDPGRRRPERHPDAGARRLLAHPGTSVTRGIPRAARRRGDRAC